MQPPTRSTHVRGALHRAQRSRCNATSRTAIPAGSMSENSPPPHGRGIANGQSSDGARYACKVPIKQAFGARRVRGDGDRRRQDAGDAAHPAQQPRAALTWCGMRCVASSKSSRRTRRVARGLAGVGGTQAGGCGAGVGDRAFGRAWPAAGAQARWDPGCGCRGGSIAAWREWWRPGRTERPLSLVRRAPSGSITAERAAACPARPLLT